MKFQDYLIEKSREQKRKQELENEVILLRAQLKGEEALNRVLCCALDCPLFCLPFLHSSFPPPVQVLLEELAMVEEEILLLERKVKELKLQLYTERHKKSRDGELHIRGLSKHNQFPSAWGYGSMINDQVITKRRDRRASLGSAIDIHRLFTSPTRSNEYEVPGKSRERSFPRKCQRQIDMGK